MSQKVMISGEAQVVPVSELPQTIQAGLGPDTEAIVTRNKDTVGVFMSIAKRNSLARAEQQLQTALLCIDMLAAGRSIEDVAASARQVEGRQGSRTEDFLAELEAER